MGKDEKYRDNDVIKTLKKSKLAEDQVRRILIKLLGLKVLTENFIETKYSAFIGYLKSGK